MSHTLIITNISHSWYVVKRQKDRIWNVWNASDIERMLDFGENRKLLLTYLWMLTMIGICLYPSLLINLNYIRAHFVFLLITLCGYNMATIAIVKMLQSWESGVRSFLWISHEGIRAQSLEPSFAGFPGHYHRAGSAVEQSRLEQSTKWDADTALRLAQYTNVPAPSTLFLNHYIVRNQC